MKMITCKEFGLKLSPPITGGRVSVLCRTVDKYGNSRIKGAKKLGPFPSSPYMVPANSPDPRKPHGRPRVNPPKGKK